MDGPKNPQKEVEVPLTTDHTTSKLYTVESLPGKGQGLVAARDISKGTRIISEKPLFVIPGLGQSEQAAAKLIASRLSLLSRDEQRAFLSLSNTSPGTSHPLLGICKTNVLPLGSDATEGGLFVQISRINHACLPNCQHTWNEAIEQETIHAVRGISKGEEITINYTTGGSFQTRRQHLKRAFGFNCTCELCSLPRIERAASDERLSEIERLDNVIGDGSRLFSSPHKCLEDAYRLFLLLEAENITDSQLARLYYDAFQIVISCGDQARAKVFAERAYEGRLRCEGDDSPATARLKPLVANPAKHRLFGVSKRWALPVKAIPRKLEGEKFEAWLWRLDK